MKARYALGIDLGTTHSSLAYASLDGSGEPRLLPLAQWEDADQVVEDERLPSFLWLLPKNILKRGHSRHPTQPGLETPWIVGRQARGIALSEPLQVVHSAKSWLSGGSLEQRSSRILPWGSEGERISPLEASRAYLTHIAACWDAAHPEAPFAEQKIVITVPASFDELAQRLTLEAAAGLGAKIELIEEPLAAFYDLPVHRAEALILVCDVGGGTSDFTLLRREADGRTERLKVSEHLLLGGDNIDLLLAHRIAGRLLALEAAQGLSELPRASWSLLLPQVRHLKETALAPEGPEVFHISVPLQARQLFGASLSLSVSRSELREWILEGFFPLVSADAVPKKSAGLQSWGLPYAKDTAITRHLAEFVRGERITQLLCVGGTLLPESLQARLKAQLESWQGGAVEALHHTQPDLAVARGAARFAWLRAMARDLVHSPYPRRLLLEVGGAAPITLMPKGHPRMTTYRPETPGLSLRLGEEVRFQLLAEADDQSLNRLPPLVLKLKSGKKGLVPVALEAAVRETGVLEVSCRALEGSEVWTLDFGLEGPSIERRQKVQALGEIKGLESAQAHIKQAFQTNGRADALPQQLETELKKAREDWSAEELRGLWPALEAQMFKRAQSPAHESSWMHLAGLCLRPGFGYQGDEERVQSLLRIYDEGFRRVDAQPKLLIQWLILWRRVAGGLPTAFQQRLFDRYMPLLRKDKDSAPELIRLLGALERLERSQKEQLGRLLLQQLKSNPRSQPEARVWALARLVNRFPVFGGAASVLPPATVEAWADEIETLQLPPKVKLSSFYAYGGRLRGDPLFDIAASYRERFIAKIDQEAWRRALREVEQPDAALQSEVLGEQLPHGFEFV